ncbi:flagellar hook-length control protein FliK [Hyphomonas jannaschiana]|uniref:flagellar hook-length control protein FliK n=1 Tax=Hyphomonas jannaschiana TaxID=86 RepID=UPI0035C724E6
MTFLIESEPAFSSAVTKPGRTANKAGTSDAGADFSRTLKQESGADSSEEVSRAPAERNNVSEAYGLMLPAEESGTAAANELDDYPAETADVADLDFLPEEADMDAAPGTTTSHNGHEAKLEDTTQAETEQETPSDARLVTVAVQAPEDSAPPNTESTSASSPAEPAAELRTDTKGHEAQQVPPSVGADKQAEMAPAIGTSQTAQTYSKDGTAAGSLLQRPASTNTPAPAPADQTSPPVTATSPQAEGLAGVSVNSPDGAAEKRPSIAGLLPDSAEGKADTSAPGHSTQTTHAPETGQQSTPPAFGALPSSQAPAQTSQPQIQMAPTQAIITASPAETVRIITDTVASPDDTPDRITVQLDPPELGRVSIDFKFDANGLQHITVTGDSPEALKQLRLMHFELTQALERNGLSSQNMTFQQQQSGQQHAHTPMPGRMFGDRGTGSDVPPLTTPNLTADALRPARTASGGLDIRL